MALNNLALLYADMEQYEKADPMYVEANEIEKRLLYCDIKGLRAKGHLAPNGFVINLAKRSRTLLPPTRLFLASWAGLPES